jgi:hypothetical protein
VRHSGHQRFSHGNTLRFIGALEYGTSMIDAFQFFLVPPNDHGEQETRELFGHVLFNYRKVWPRHRHAAWGHCLSAWRVLGNHLLQNNHELLISLRKQKKSHRSTQWLPISAARMPTEKHADHVAPAARWLP